jgi:TRAP-type uncharacterized transport system substrate-binding protein
MNRPGNRLTDRLRLLLVLAAIVLLVAGIWWALDLWAPSPPRSVTMATGPEGATYAGVAERYRAILARAGVELRLRPTAGAVENLALLREAGSGVSVGFVVAGTAKESDSETLVSLGTVFYEPLWLFNRGLNAGHGIAGLRGKRIAIGPEGSGTRELALYFLGLIGIDSGSAELLPLTPEESADSLARGEIDVAPILSSWDSPLVHRLLGTPGVELAGFPRADAHLALNPHLSKLVLPAGVADLARNIPPTDVVLVATKGNLVVRRDLHPAIQYLLLDAAEEVHSRPGVFHRPGQFPAAETIDLPLSEYARQFHKSGRPWLQRFLSFRVAILAERLLILLVPLLGIVYPLAKSLPALYTWAIRRRIFRLYGQLKLIEIEAERAGDEGSSVGLLARLNDLDERVTHLRVTRPHAWLAYTLRHHINLVREKLQKGR